jgi:hypothetical protein
VPERYYRLHPEDSDPEDLLDPEKQKTEPWGGTIYGKCDKCEGEGKTWHEHREQHDECPACKGTGEIDDSERDGVSVFRDEDALYEYMKRRGADIAGSVLVVLDGLESADRDFDADEGALLLRPERIVDVREPKLTH